MQEKRWTLGKRQKKKQRRKEEKTGEEERWEGVGTLQTDSEDWASEIVMTCVENHLLSYLLHLPLQKAPREQKERREEGLTFDRPFCFFCFFFSCLLLPFDETVSDYAGMALVDF